MLPHCRTFGATQHERKYEYKKHTAVKIRARAVHNLCRRVNTSKGWNFAKFGADIKFHKLHTQTYTHTRRL